MHHLRDNFIDNTIKHEKVNRHVISIQLENFVNKIINLQCFK